MVLHHVPEKTSSLLHANMLAHMSAESNKMNLTAYGGSDTFVKMQSNKFTSLVGSRLTADFPGHNLRYCAMTEHQEQDPLTL
eukprot:2247797-Pyramimonas_sp.AAC.1